MDNIYQSLNSRSNTNSNSNNSNTDENLLDEFDVILVQASHGQRFVNLIVDGVVFYIVLVGTLVAIPGALNLFFFPFMQFILYALWQSFLEIVLKGKTVGKLFTGTRAIQEDGAPITVGIALQRGFSRIVPFEAFSALGTPCWPWHDKWTHTFVVVESESRGI